MCACGTQYIFSCLHSRFHFLFSWHFYRKPENFSKYSKNRKESFFPSLCFFPGLPHLILSIPTINFSPSYAFFPSNINFTGCDIFTFSSSRARERESERERLRKRKNLQRRWKLTFDLLNTFFHFQTEIHTMEIYIRHRKQCNNFLSHFIIWFLGELRAVEKKRRKKQRKKSILSVWVRKKRASEKNLTFSWWNFAMFFFLFCFQHEIFDKLLLI